MPHNFTKLILLITLILAMPGNSQNSRKIPGASDPSKAKIGDYIELDKSIRNDIYGTIDFPNADLKDIIKAISKMSGKNFILDRKIDNRKITILSPEKVTKQEAYNAFLSALYANDLTVVSLGKFLKIIEVKSALQSNTRVFVGEYVPASEEIVTVLYSLKNIDAEQAQRNLTELVPRTGRIDDFPETNTLVMTDTGINLRRLISIIKHMDTPGHQDQLTTIKINNGSAKEIASLIDEILEAQSGGSSRVSTRRRRGEQKKTRGGGIITKIVPDERTNSLVVLANGRGIQELRDLIRKLDTSNVSGGGNIHVYYCKNSVAEDLAETINKLISGVSSTRDQTNRSGARNTRSSPLSRITTRNSRPSNNRKGAISLQGNVKVEADKATNSLVIVASGSDYASLKRVLEKLDLPRRQVYVETTIMELNVGDNQKFGISVNIADDNLPSIGGLNPANGGSSITQLLTPGGLSGLAAGFTAGKIVKFDLPNGTSVDINSVVGLVNFIQDANLGQILHQPQILTSDNEDAQISVTKKIKTLTTTTTGTGSSTPVTTETPETNEVKIRLKITPRLSRTSDLVRLKIEQDVDTFARALVAAGQIDVTVRAAETSVVVRDGDTVVIGGLQTEEVEDSRSKVPLLGDLPLIGWLFKGKVSSVKKSNLIIFLTPYIINEYSDIIRLTERKIDQRLKQSSKLKDPSDHLHHRVLDIRKTLRKSDKNLGWGPSPEDGTPIEDIDDLNELPVEGVEFNESTEEEFQNEVEAPVAVEDSSEYVPGLNEIINSDFIDEEEIVEDNGIPSPSELNPDPPQTANADPPPVVEETLIEATEQPSFDTPSDSGVSFEQGE